MCSACAMAAMAGATSARAWIRLNVPWLATKQRMRAVTAGLLMAGTLVASVGLQGSSAPVAQAQAPVAHAQAPAAQRSR